MEYHSYWQHDEPKDGLVPMRGIGCGIPTYNFTDFTVASKAAEIAVNKDIFDKKIITIPDELEEFLDDGVGGMKFAVQADRSDLVGTYTLTYEMRLSVYADWTDPVAHPVIPVEFKSFEIRILACVVTKVKGELDVPTYVEFLVDQDPLKYEWDEYIQEPMCNYTVSYTLTSTELTSG